MKIYNNVLKIPNFKSQDNYKNNDCEIDLSNFDNLCNEFIESLKLFKDVDRDKLIKSIKDGLA